MMTRFGSVMKDIGEADKDGFCEATLYDAENGKVMDVRGRKREVHLGDMRTETDADRDWMNRQCARVAELRA